MVRKYILEDGTVLYCYPFSTCRRKSNEALSCVIKPHVAQHTGAYLCWVLMRAEKQEIRSELCTGMKNKFVVLQLYQPGGQQNCHCSSSLRFEAVPF